MANVSVTAWNRMVDRYFAGRIIAFKAAPRRPWRHPWSTTVRWDEDLGQWLARIKPGFCWNGKSFDVEVTTTPALAGDRAADRLELSEDARGETNTEVAAFLSELPEIPIPQDLWRAVGTDATAFAGEAEPVPEFFQARGVLDPAEVGASDDAFGEVTLSIQGDVAARSEARLLRACEVVLRHDRPRTSVDFTFGDGQSGSIAQMGLIVETSPSARAHAYLNFQRSYTPPVDVPPVAIMLTGNTGDPGRDETRIATLWLLSVPGESSPGAPKGGGWQAYVEYHEFWDLQYHTNITAPPEAPTVVTVPGAENIAGGIAAQVGNPILATINDNLAELEAALAQNLVSGRFWNM